MVVQNAGEQLPLSWAHQLTLSGSYLTDATASQEGGVGRMEPNGA